MQTSFPGFREAAWFYGGLAQGLKAAGRPPYLAASAAECLMHSAALLAGSLSRESRLSARDWYRAALVNAKASRSNVRARLLEPYQELLRTTGVFRDLP